MHLVQGKGSTTAPVPTKAKMRLDSIDALRGLVILIMALDHVREYLSIVKGYDTSTMAGAPVYFFTRWITHFCAPVFVFLAGTSAFLSMGGGRRTVNQLSRFLVTRGLWLILMEWTVIGFGFFFNTTYTSANVKRNSARRAGPSWRAIGVTSTPFRKNFTATVVKFVCSAA